MKTILLAGMIALAPAVADAIEMPDYAIVKRDGPITVRQYEPMLLVQAEGGGPHNLFREDQRPVFNVLFRYISGENVAADRVAMTNPVFVEPGAGRSERIAMTNPVFVEPENEAGRTSEDGRWTMSFFLPERFSKETAPIPTGDGARVTEYGPMQVAVIRFSGIMTAEREAEHFEILSDWIARNGLQPTGPRLLGFYDPPWVPAPLRTNEVMIPVTAP